MFGALLSTLEDPQVCERLLSTLDAPSLSARLTAAAQAEGRAPRAGDGGAGLALPRHGLGRSFRPAHGHHEPGSRSRLAAVKAILAATLPEGVA